MQSRPSVVKSQRAWSATMENDPSWGERAYAGKCAISFQIFSDFHFRYFPGCPVECGRKRAGRGIKKSMGSFLNIQARDDRGPGQGSGRGAGGGVQTYVVSKPAR